MVREFGTFCLIAAVCVVTIFALLARAQQHPERTSENPATASSSGSTHSAATPVQQWRPVRPSTPPPQRQPAVAQPVVQAPDYEAHVAKLRKSLQGTGHTVLIEKPFVVIGNQKPSEVKRWSEGTIRWATTKLKKEYFKKDPYRIIDIWLFKDAKTYKQGTKALVGYEPNTPYGFFMSSKDVLVMNISTGGGTLVHEIVHPFIEANFPDCPSWFNEGLASLYEQSSERNSKIMGLTNWRLRGLQLAIRDGDLGSFKKLTSTTTREFYDGDSTNYAQARYLCYFLQERGVLQDFYKSFVANQKTDPTGIETLKSILKTEDLEGFQTKWEEWILTLRFP